MDENTNNNSLVDELADGVVIDDPQDGAEAPETDENVVDDETIINAIKNPSEAVKQALQGIVTEAVKKALAKNTPKRSTVRIDPITKEQFTQMSYDERVDLYNTNRPLYEKLKGEY